MPKVRRIGGWLVIAGIALMVQGCWEDEQQLSLLGEGGCRTADGRDGKPTYFSGVSLDECQAKCFDANGECTAVEYNSNNQNCEIHSAAITRISEVEGVSCYVRD